MLRKCGSRQLVPLAMLLPLAVGSGCVPLISQEDFLDFASDYGLAPELTCEQLKVMFGVPQLTTVRHPGEIGLAFEEVCVATITGELLRVWYVPAAQERGTILLAYGAVGELPCYLLLTKNLVAAGWSMVMYDYQGFGGSTGSPTFASLMIDHDAVLDWALARTGRPQLTLMGISIGTIPSVAQAARHPEVVNAVILDGVVSLRTQLQQFWFLIGGRTRQYLHVFEPALHLDEQITRVHKPIQAFIYGRDEWTRPREIRRILAGAGGEVRSHEFTDLAHARGPYLATELYFAELETFLRQVWPRGDGNLRAAGE